MYLFFKNTGANCVKRSRMWARAFSKADGGDVELVDVNEAGIVKVRLTGACGGCPMATMTLKKGIERILKQEVPEVQAVEQA